MNKGEIMTMNCQMTEKKVWKRNGTIEFMRFVMAVVIVLGHTGVFNVWVARGGYIPVEFFFMVTGYLMYKKVSSFERTDLIGESTHKMLCKKIGGFYIEFILSTIIAIVLLHSFFYQTRPNIDQFFSLFIGDVFLLQIWGFPCYAATGILWYLSSMMSGLLILVPLIMRFRDCFIHVIAPFLVLMIYGFMVSTWGNIPHIMEPVFGGAVHIGLVRGIAGMMLGCELFYITEKIQNIDFSLTGKVMLTIGEIIGYVGTICIAIKQGDPSNLDFLMVFLLAMGICISFSEKSFSTKWFSNKYSYGLGKISVNMFLNHFCWAQILSLYMKEWSSLRLMTIYFCGTIVTTALNVYLAKFFRTYFKKFKVSEMFID